MTSATFANVLRSMRLPVCYGGFVPIERRVWIGTLEVDVVKTDLIRILHDLDLGAPRVLDESEFEFALHITHFANDLYACCFVAAHLCGKVGE